MIRAALIALAIALTVALGVRVVEAAEQCAFPTFAYTTACFTHDVVTGEDL